MATIHLIDMDDKGNKRTRCGKAHHTGMSYTGTEKNVTCADCLHVLLIEMYRKINKIVAEYEGEVTREELGVGENRTDGTDRTNKTVKPPLGIMPQRIWKENRMWDLIAELHRYQGQPTVNVEWMQELKVLLNELF